MFNVQQHYFLHAHSSMSVDAMTVVGLGTCKTKQSNITMYITMLNYPRVVMTEKKCNVNKPSAASTLLECL